MASVASRALLMSVWVLCACGVLWLTFSMTGESKRFYGIADDLEQAVSFAEPVRIKAIHVVAGQSVVQGQTIVDVAQPSLEAELSFLEERVQALALERDESATTLHAEIEQLKNALTAELLTVDSEIAAMERGLQVSRELLGDSAAMAGARAPASQALLRLRNKRSALRASTTARVTDLQLKLNAKERPIDAQIAELNERRRTLREQLANLRVKAKRDGRVGSILFKPGDTVQPFQTIATLHRDQPTFIRGYIHESVSNKAAIGQTVWIVGGSESHAKQRIRGSIESLGRRIVEMPVRLKVSPTAQAWGREVRVRLDEPHALLLGEKVSVNIDARPWLNVELLSMNSVEGRH